MLPDKSARTTAPRAGTAPRWPAKRRGRSRRPLRRGNHFGACQMLFGITQWMFFSLSEIAPTRQSMAMLASP